MSADDVAGGSAQPPLQATPPGPRRSVGTASLTLARVRGFVAAGHPARGFNPGASHDHYVHLLHPHLRDLRPLFARQPLWYACADAAAREDWGIPRALPSLRSSRSPDFSPTA